MGRVREDDKPYEDGPDPQTTAGWSRHVFHEFSRRGIWHYFNAGSGMSLCGYWLPWKVAKARRMREWDQAGNCKTCERALAAAVARAVDDC